ncbi:MAG: YdcF family protein [Chlorobium sp.]|nr:MAG: YdcF family protein [Chlorobium sp.]
MVFFNKLAAALLLPFGLALLCILGGLAFKRRLLVWAGFFVLLLFSMPVTSDMLMRSVEGDAGRASAVSVQNADAIVVLSGMLNQVKGAPLGEWGDGADRYEGGIELFKAGKAPVIVFTKGLWPWRTNATPEGELLAARAVRSGIPPSAIFLTGNAGNTAEEAKAVRKLLGSGVNGRTKTIILVTSAYHMRRSMLLFENSGFHVIPFRVDYQVGYVNPLTLLDFLPDANSLEQSEKAIREVYGCIFYKIMTNISAIFQHS